MFGMRDRDCGSSHEGRWAGGRRWRRHFGGDFGGGGRHGMGGGEMMRAGRMLAQGDLRLIALALIAEQPRHGYEIIKVLEDKTAGWYSPSPGIVYPTLTYLEEAGYVTVQADGAKKLYTITEEGRAHLAGNQDFVDAVLARLSAIGEKATRIREHFARPEYEDEGRGRRRGRGDRGRGDDDRDSVPPLVRAALENLRDIAAGQIEADEDAETKIVEVLARAAQELKKS
jgi:DNA-binding PadR family transcriptional regulator